MEGYAVTVQNGLIIPEDQFLSDAGRVQVARWVAGRHIGVWHDKKHREFALDVTEVIADRAEAIQLGIQRDQQSIYDLAGGKPIPTGGTGGRQQDASRSSKPPKPISQATTLSAKHCRMSYSGLPG